MVSTTHNDPQSDAIRSQSSNLKLQPLDFIPPITGSIKEADALTIQADYGRHRQLSPLQGTPHLPSKQEPSPLHNPLDFDATTKAKSLEPLRHSHPLNTTSAPSQKVQTTYAFLEHENHHRNIQAGELSPIHNPSHKQRNHDANNKPTHEAKANRVLSPLSIPPITSQEPKSLVHNQNPARHNTLSPIEHANHNYNHTDSQIMPEPKDKDKERNMSHLPPLKQNNPSASHNVDEVSTERHNQSPVTKLPPVSSAIQSSPERAHPKKLKPGQERHEYL